MYEPEREDEAPVEGARHGDGIGPDSKIERLQGLMLQVLDGTISRGRSLKYWENLKLNPKHIQMLVMKAAGFTNNYIAAEFEMTAARVSVIVNHPDAQSVLSRLISYQAEELIDVKSRIRAHSAEALDISLDVMRNARDDGLKLKAAFGLLDRGGYGAVQRSEAKIEVSLPIAAANAIGAALRESQEVEDADWEVEEEAVSNPCVSSSAMAGETGGSDQYIGCAEEPPLGGQPIAIMRVA